MTQPTLVRRLAVTILAAVTLAGCTSGQEDQPAERDDPRPPPSAEPLADRDRAAVLAALRGLDTCEVLLAASAGLIAPPPDTVTRFRFPTICVLASSSTGLGLVSLQVFDAWPQPITSLIGEHRRMLGGATAFVNDDRPSLCEVHLPVSPTTALEVQANDPDATKSPCALAESLATAVAETLDEPGRLPPAPRWDPCDALTAAHGGTPDGYDGYDGSFSTASCTDKASGATFRFLAGEPGSSGSEAPGAAPWRLEPVAGTEVWFSDRPAKGLCDAQWAAGQLDSPYSVDSSDVLLAQVTAKSCTDASAMLEPLVGVLQQQPPEVAPQRPVLYPA